jgi:RimJ/RimL family protein N-acetyltransferase
MSNLVINMQKKVAECPNPEPAPAGILVLEMDTNNPREIESWINIINRSYPDKNETLKSFDTFFNRHPFADIKKILLFWRGDVAVGTIGIGIYHKNQLVGGEFHLAILPEEQGKGIALYALGCADRYLKNSGVSNIENIVSFKRKHSIKLHIRAGFKPQFNRSLMVVDVQKRMWPVRLIVRSKVQRLYKALQLTKR